MHVLLEQLFVQRRIFKRVVSMSNAFCFQNFHSLRRECTLWEGLANVFRYKGVLWCVTFWKMSWAVVVCFFCNILQYLQYDLVLGREMHFTDRISSQNHSKSDCYTIFHLYNRKQMAKHHVSLRSKFCVVGVFCWIHHCKCWAKEESYTSFTTLAWPTSPACTVLCTSLLTASCQKQNSVNSQLEHCLFFCRLGKKQHVVSKYSTAASVVCIALCLFY